MDKGFMIDELVFLGGLELPVEDEAAAEASGADDLKELGRGLGRVEDIRYTVLVHEVGVDDVMEPQARIFSHGFPDPSRLPYQDSSLDFHDRGVLAAQPLDEQFRGQLAVHRVATGEDVHGGKAMLRPGM
jgi:hypothetical protein